MLSWGEKSVRTQHSGVGCQIGWISPHTSCHYSSCASLWEFSEHMDWSYCHQGHGCCEAYLCLLCLVGLWTLVAKRIQSVFNKLKRLGFLAENISFEQICLERDTKLYSQILINPHHVLHQLLPPVRNVPYSLRPRVHDRKFYHIKLSLVCLEWTFVKP